MVDPDRTAASNDASGEADLFATSLSGRLYYRHGYTSKLDWLAWQELVPPRPGTPIADIASTGGEKLDGSHLYVAAADGRLYDRTKRTIDGTLKFDAWRVIGGVSPRRLAARSHADGQQTLLVLDTDGVLVTAHSAAGEPFEAAPVWTALPARAAVVSVDLADDLAGRTMALALDADGMLWTCRGVPSCSWTARAGTVPKLVEIAAGTFFGQPATLFGLDAAGVAHIAFDGDSSEWRPLMN